MSLSFAVLAVCGCLFGEPGPTENAPYDPYQKKEDLKQQRGYHDCLECRLYRAENLIDLLFAEIKDLKINVFKDELGDGDSVADAESIPLNPW